MSVYLGEQKADIFSGIPKPKLQYKSVTENGTVTADEGYDGLDEVTVNVNVQTFPPKYNLPSGYEQLSYLQSTGTQYIILDYIPNINTVFEFIAINRQHSEEYMCGVSNVSAGYGYWIDINQGKLYIKMGVGNYTSIIEEAYTHKFIISSTQAKAKIFYPQTDTIRLNNYSYSAPQPENEIKCVLFGMNQSTNPYPSKVYLSEFVITENDTEMLHLIPARNTIIDELGMYDIVNNHLYTNDGTGVFIGGEFE